MEQQYEKIELLEFNRENMTSEYEFVYPMVRLDELDESDANFLALTLLENIEGVVVHHSDSGPETTVADIDSWHRQKGWDGIGYHGVVLGDGSFGVGRPLNKMGAHALGYNSKTLGVCVVGDFENGGDPYEEQIKTLIQVLASWCKRFNLPVGRIYGHRDVNDTSCPGSRLYVQLPEIRREVARYL